MPRLAELTLSIFLSISLIIFSACSSGVPGNTSSNSTNPTTTAATLTTAASSGSSATSTGDPLMSYQMIKTVPPDLEASVNSLKKSRGYHFFAAEKLLVVFMGERPTGGYQIMLKSLGKSGNALMVRTSEKSPGPTDLVTQAFTYPMLLIQLQEIFTTFTIEDSNGAAYAALGN